MVRLILAVVCFDGAWLLAETVTDGSAILTLSCNHGAGTLVRNSGRLHGRSNGGDDGGCLVLALRSGRTGAASVGGLFVVIIRQCDVGFEGLE
jgi:hypothetical protein